MIDRTNDRRQTEIDR